MNGFHSDCPRRPGGPGLRVVGVVRPACPRPRSGVVEVLGERWSLLVWTDAEWDATPPDRQPEGSAPLDGGGRYALKRLTPPWIC